MLGVRYIAAVRHDDDRAPWVMRKLFESQGEALEGGTKDSACDCGEEHLARILVCDLDDLPVLDASEQESYERAERLMTRYMAEVERIRADWAGRGVDKTDQTYEARARRTHELRDAAAVEVRRMLEALRPPNFVIETRQNTVPTPAPERTWFGREHDQLAADPNTWIATLRDPNPKGSDAHIYVMARTENGALAKLLAHILDGGGFFPMT